MKSQEWSLDLIRTTRQRMVGQNQFTLKAPSPPPRCPHLRKNRSRAKLEQCDHKASKFNKIISVNLRWQRGYLCHHQREPKRVSGCKHMWWCFSSQKKKHLRKFCLHWPFCRGLCYDGPRDRPEISVEAAGDDRSGEHARGGKNIYSRFMWVINFMLIKLVCLVMILPNFDRSSTLWRAGYI